MKKIVLNIRIECVKCQTCVMKTIAKVKGIDEVKIDAEKGLVTLVGHVDPVKVVKKLRKIKVMVTIESVGPYKEEKPPTPPKPQSPKPEPPKPPCCSTCQPVVVGFVAYDDPPFCTIV